MRALSSGAMEDLLREGGDDVQLILTFLHVFFPHVFQLPFILARYLYALVL